MPVERPLPVTGQAPRMTELYVWTATDPLTDTEGIISVRAPGGGFVLPLVTSIRRLAETTLRAHAERVVSEAQDPKPTIQLRRFVPAEEESP